MHYQSCYFICSKFFSKIHSVCLIGGDPVKLVYFKKKKLVYLCNFFKQRKACIILTEPYTAH